MMAKRLVSAHAYGGESKEEAIRAIAKGQGFDIMLTDPLGLGSGIVDIQELDDSVIVKLTDATKKKWMLFVEHRDGDSTSTRNSPCQCVGRV